jgi:hypothetical protein
MFAPLASKATRRSGGDSLRPSAPFAHRPASASFPQRVAGDVVASNAAPATLAVGLHDDPLERDADQIAARALDESEPSATRPTRLDSARRDGEMPAPSSVHAALRAPGQPLDPAARAAFEPRFGHDFSAVRIHADAASADAARSVGANAFTLGSDIVFGPGRYELQDDPGRRLLAHELAHVVQQGGNPSCAILRRDGPPDPPLKEAKKEDATDAVTGGLKTVADEATKSEPLKNYGLALAKQYALPIWTRMGTGDKVATVGTAAAMYGLGVGSLLSDPGGRAKLSGVNFVAPVGLIPYATLSGFSYDLPQAKTDPLALHFSFKGDDLLDLAHRKLSSVPPLTLSFDFTMTVAPDGKVAMPSALANVGVLPGVGIAGGYGLTTDLPQMTQARQGEPLVPYKSFPQPAQPAPRGAVAVFATIDLLKAPILPKSIRAALGGDVSDKK